MLAMLHCWFFGSSTEYIHVHIILFCIYSLMSLSVINLFDIQLFVINHLSFNLIGDVLYISLSSELSVQERELQMKKWSTKYSGNFSINHFFMFLVLLFFTMLCSFCAILYQPSDVPIIYLIHLSRVHRYPLMCSLESQLY